MVVLWCQQIVLGTTSTTTMPKGGESEPCVLRLTCMALGVAAGGTLVLNSNPAHTLCWCASVVHLMASQAEH